MVLFNRTNWFDYNIFYWLCQKDKGLITYNKSHVTHDTFLEAYIRKYFNTLIALSILQNNQNIPCEASHTQFKGGVIQVLQGGMSCEFKRVLRGVKQVLHGCHRGLIFPFQTPPTCDFLICHCALIAKTILKKSENLHTQKNKQSINRNPKIFLFFSSCTEERSSVYAGPWFNWT